LLDQVAYACAAKYCKQYVVTMSLDQVLFRQKIQVGELVTFFAHVNYVGRSSMEVGIKVVAEDLRSHEKRHTTSCYFTMVAVDDEGKSTPVPPLVIQTELEKQLYQSGAMRQQMRKDYLNKIAELHVDLPKDNL
jgi:acyl-CoA hydrolase